MAIKNWFGKEMERNIKIKWKKNSINRPFKPTKQANNESIYRMTESNKKRRTIFCIAGHIKLLMIESEWASF